MSPYFALVVLLTCCGLSGDHVLSRWSRPTASMQLILLFFSQRRQCLTCRLYLSTAGKPSSCLLHLGFLVLLVEAPPATRQLPASRDAWKNLICKLKNAPNGGSFVNGTRWLLHAFQNCVNSSFEQSFVKLSGCYPLRKSAVARKAQIQMQNGYYEALMEVQNNLD